MKVTRTADPRTRRRAWLALLLLVPAPSIGVLMALWWFPEAGGRYVWMASKVHLLVFPVLWWRLVAGGAWSLSPLPRGRRARGLLLGAGSGLVIFAAIWVAYLMLGQRLIEPGSLRTLLEKNQVATPAAYLGLAAYLSLVNALTEEYVWRWFVVRQGALLGGPGHGIFWGALFFSVHHCLAVASYFGGLITVLVTVGTFLGSIVWSLLYLRTGSLWPAYVSHVLADLGVFTVGWVILFS